MAKKKAAARKKEQIQFLGSGFIWFFGDRMDSGYHRVGLYTQKNGGGSIVRLRTGELGGWQKVRLFAKYSE